MRYLINAVYLLVILVASPWLLYGAIFQRKYRAGLRQKILGDLPVRVGDRPCLWLHAVSVGEVNLLKTLLPSLRRKRPLCDYVITTTTRTGYELATSHFPDCTVSYAPLDFSWSVRRGLRNIRPDVLLLVELELWPNLIALASDAGVAIAIVNGRLSEQSFRGYQRLRPIVNRMLRSLPALGVQNETYAARFQQLGCDPKRIQVTGSVKFDGVETDRENAATCTLKRTVGLLPENRVFLAGSTQSPEEQLALQSFLQLQHDYSQLRLILVPRHPERFDSVARELNASGVRWLRRSQLNGQKLDARHRVLLVDTIGELGAWWGTADIAFVGGSLGRRGGQNMLEPAGYGAAISFGPHTKNFRDITRALLEESAAVVVRDGPALTDFVRRCLQDAPYAMRMGCRARHFVVQQSGALQKTIDMLDSLLPSEGRSDQQRDEFVDCDRAFYTRAS